MPFQSAKIIADNVPYAQYALQSGKRGDRDYVMSRGSLMAFAACPMKWRKGFESPDSKASEWGVLMDCLALSPQNFESLVAVCPETYTDAKSGEKKPWNFNANVCKDWRKDQGDRLIVKHDAYVEAQTALKALLEDDQIAAVLKFSRKQVHAVANYKDAATGLTIPVKILIDIVPDESSDLFGKSLADLKTSVSAEQFAWRRKIFQDDLDAQAALYLDVYTAATGEDRIEFRHVIQESCPPWQTGRRVVSSEFLDIGRAKYESALRSYARCLAENVWPDYDTFGRVNFGGWNIASPEPWMLQQTMQDVFPEIQQPVHQEEMQDIIP